MPRQDPTPIRAQAALGGQAATSGLRLGNFPLAEASLMLHGALTLPRAANFPSHRGSFRLADGYLPLRAANLPRPEASTPLRNGNFPFRGGVRGLRTEGVVNAPDGLSSGHPLRRRGWSAMCAWQGVWNDCLRLAWWAAVGPSRTRRVRIGCRKAVFVGRVSRRRDPPCRRVGNVGERRVTPSANPPYQALPPNG